MMEIDYIESNDEENVKTVQKFIKIMTSTHCCISSAIHSKHQDQLKNYLIRKNADFFRSQQWDLTI